MWVEFKLSARPPLLMTSIVDSKWECLVRTSSSTFVVHDLDHRSHCWVSKQTRSEYPACCTAVSRLVLQSVYPNWLHRSVVLDCTYNWCQGLLCTYGFPHACTPVYNHTCLTATWYSTSKWFDPTHQYLWSCSHTQGSELRPHPRELEKEREVGSVMGLGLVISVHL